MKNFNFTIGENLGEILFQIACNHIQKGDVDKAISTYVDSLDGFSKELVKSLLKNECVLITNEAKDSLEVSTNEEDIEANKKNIVDWHDVLADKVEYLQDTISHIYDLRNHVLPIDPVSVDIKSLSVGKKQINVAAQLIAGEKKLHLTGENLWEDLVYDCENGYATRDEVALLNIVNYVHSIRQLYKNFFETLNFYNTLKHFDLIDKFAYIESTFERGLILLEEFSDDEKGYHHPACDEQIHELKEKIYDDIYKTEIGREFLKDLIVTKNPEDFYDAAWISPEGKFYGVMGETTDLLHLNLAQQICIKIDKDNSIADDEYLTNRGWIKVHHNEAYAFLAYNKKIAEEENRLYAPTEAQIETLCKYMDAHFNGKFYTEFRGIGGRTVDPQSTRNIKQMDEIALHKAFEF